MFAMRLEALPGGEEGGGGGRGVCCALTWGTGTLPLGSFGVFRTCRCGDSLRTGASESIGGRVIGVGLQGE